MFRLHQTRHLVVSMLALIFALSVAQAAAAGVQWPSLKRLDDLAERCEALSDKKDVSGLRKIAAEVKSAMKVVTSDAVPKGAKQPSQVKVLQGDLKSLADALGDPKKQDGEELTAILAGVHPLVEALMAASGMPHVHEGAETKGRSK